jgi:hypothetical protein
MAADTGLWLMPVQYNPLASGAAGGNALMSEPEFTELMNFQNSGNSLIQ